MKKKLLAVGVAAALGLGAGAASAQTAVAENGVGHANILPYYSVQDGNATLIHITNTDTSNGKAVKVRFRGAEWSDDVFDFQLFLSPGDVWTGAVTQNGSVASLVTTDNSCTLPANVNRDFITERLFDSAEGTLEGYVEVLTMADIPEPLPVDLEGSLYEAIKHVNGVAPCTTTVLNALQEDNFDVYAGVGNVALAPVAGLSEQGMDAPTASLMTFGTIINVPDSRAFTIAATAIEYAAPAKSYFRQTNQEIAEARIPDLTLDRIFYTNVADGTDLPMYQFDMPDLTSPINEALPVDQRDAIATELEKAGVLVEYVTSDSILATTDIVFGQPVRRFFYLYDGPDVANQYLINGGRYNINGEDKYADLDGETNRIAVGVPSFWDREERTIVPETDIVISPTPPSVALTYSLKGEVSVLSVNNGSIPTGSLSASLTANNYETGLAQPDGWASLSLTTEPSNELLPTIGFSAINVFNAGVGGAGTNYGMTLPLRGY